jgi:hypothetical protein
MGTGRGLRQVAALAALLAAGCGGSGGGGGGGGRPSEPLPVVDVAVRGNGLSGPRILVYRDALRAEPGDPPDVRISPPASIAFMALLGSHLVLGADFGVANQNRIWVYGPADLAEANPTPAVQCLLSPPAGAVNVSMRGLVLHGADLYVHSVYDDGDAPRTFTWMTHVFRDVTTLPNAAPADARVTHDTLTTSLLLLAHESVAVDDDVLLVTGLGSVYVTQDPETLAGEEVPDGALALSIDLDVSSSSRVVLGGGEAYFYSFAVEAVAGAVDLQAGDPTRFRLLGPSTVQPGDDAVVRVGDRLFARAAPGSGVAIVGFDVAGPVPDFAPPDVMLGAPVFGDQRLAGAGGALFAVSTASGVVAGYARPSLLVDGDEPSVFLYDTDVVQTAELRAVQVP